LGRVLALQADAASAAIHVSLKYQLNRLEINSGTNTTVAQVAN
jgi:hypothetical protein